MKFPRDTTGLLILGVFNKMLALKPLLCQFKQSK